jgi:hypothetical protein
MMDSMHDDDDMKSDLLEELIQKLMEMPDSKGGDENKTAVMAGKVGMPGMDDNDGDEPDAKLAMLDIKKPSLDPKAALDMSAMGKGEDEEDMKKPLDPMDFMSMRKKHMGL